MSASSVLLRGRAAAEALMQDAVIVKRGTSSTDSETGVITPAWTTIYAGPCKVQQAAPATSPSDVGEAAVFVGQLQLHVPVNATTAGIHPDDLAEITACVLDPSLVGATFRVRGPAHKSFATARRFPLVEAT